MNCEEFEPLMADALGDELAASDRAAFEDHLSSCERCRGEYQSMQVTVARMKALSAPRRVTLRREGNRLVIGPPQVGRHRVPFWLTGTAFRYAASLLLAFAAGYSLHAGLMFVEIGGGSSHRFTRVEPPPDEDRGTSFQEALLLVHQRNPGYTDLAKCILALGPQQR